MQEAQGPNHHVLSLSLSLSLSFRLSPPNTTNLDSPMRVLAARDLLSVEQHVRDGVEPRDDEVDGRLRQSGCSVDVEGALERPDLLGDVAVLALVESVGLRSRERERACKTGEMRGVEARERGRENESRLLGWGESSERAVTEASHASAGPLSRLLRRLQHVQGQEMY